jgi:hypothetical protein
MRAGWTALAIALLLAVAAIVVVGGRGPAGPGASPGAPRRPGAVSPPAPPSEPAARGAGESAPLESGATLEVSRRALRGGAPLVLELRLGEPDAGVEPLSGRIVVAGRTPRDLTPSLVGRSGSLARVEIDADWLASPGRYIVEVKTNERTHLPLRRYVLEVR